MAMLDKRSTRFMKSNRGKKFNRKGDFKNKNKEEEKDQLICYECKKSENIRTNCPKLKKKSFEKKKKLKAHVVTWRNEESSDEEEQEVANLCLMAIEDDLKGGIATKPKLHVQIHDTLIVDAQGKFDAKSDETIFLGYSLTSKAYRVFNKRTLVVGESIHVVFDDNLLPRKDSYDDDDDDVGTKWVFRNKLDESGNIVRNKDRLVAQGYTQEGIDFDETYAPVARIDSSFDLHAYSDADYEGCKIDRKSTSGTCQFLAGSCCAQVLWMKQQLFDYGIDVGTIPIKYDNTSVICLTKNPIQHSRAKHIEIRHHFIRDHVLQDDIVLEYVDTLHQLADIVGLDDHNKNACQVVEKFDFRVIVVEAKDETINTRI
ncbi:hypothetical protein V6N11_039571 [Hibiscus sabdariffa]|uniref:Uncharacterized protein n=1 Tax=Hibiscus sabdariffa TaxID=183260 RepID=A0ABR2SP76_9ROSI